MPSAELIYRFVVEDKEQTFLGGVSQKCDVGAKIPENPRSFAGYTFSKWQNMPEDGLMPSGTFTLVGLYTPNTYRITFTSDMAGASLPPAMELAYGTALDNLPTATLEGYTFTGWTLVSGNKLPVYVPASDLTLVAQFTANRKVTITFDTDGGRQPVPSMTVDYGTVVSKHDLPVPTYDPSATYSSVTFTGWRLSDGAEFPESKTITEDITLYATWISST